MFLLHFKNSDEHFHELEQHILVDADAELVADAARFSRVSTLETSPRLCGTERPRTSMLQVHVVLDCCLLTVQKGKQTVQKGK